MIHTASGIDASVQADVDISTDAYVNVYGTAGVPYAESVSEFIIDQTILLDSGASVVSEKGSVALRAGGPDFGDQNISVTSGLRVWNATALPIGRMPYAKTLLDTDTNVTVQSGAELRAGLDVLLEAGQGNVTTSSYGLASDLYREVAEEVVNALGSLVGADEVSLDTEVGVLSERITEDVVVLGEVEAGKNYFQELYANSTGIVRQTDGIDAVLLADVNLLAELEDALNTLRADLVTYADDPLLSTRLESEITRLELLLEQAGSGTINLILVTDAYSAPGDVGIVADSLSGTGTIIAHGDATIQIVNDGPAAVEVVDALIPFRGGGLVTLNEVPINAVTAPDALVVQASSDAGSSVDPVITIENRYNAPEGPRGDIFITGTLENLRGLVSATTTDGSIYVLGGAIDAAEVQISSGGDLFLSADYDDLLFNVGPDSLANFIRFFQQFSNKQGPSNGVADVVADLSTEPLAVPDTRGSIVGAEGGVYIYANNHVHLSGLIRSGITDYDVYIDDNIASVLDELPASERIAVLYSPAGVGTSPAEDPMFPKASGNVTLRYDQDAGVILVDPIRAAAGRSRSWARLSRPAGLNCLRPMAMHASTSKMTVTSR